MKYRESFISLKKIFNQVEDVIQIPGSKITIYNHTFQSNNSSILPGASQYICKKHGKVFFEKHRLDNKVYFRNSHESLRTEDCDISDNREFRYTIFKEGDSQKAKDFILLFHGLNEKYWTKYLPWAKKLVELTGKAVVLFPIAFHMNRSPAEWSKPKLMQIISNERKEHFTSVVDSTFANAAISARIQMLPQRFFWSGLQSYYDAVQFVEEVRKGINPFIDKNAGVNIFAYSIGSFLAEIILMTNHENIFNKSKLFIFCGGPTIDRMYPVSKYILDSDANISLYSFFIEHLENEFKRDERLSHFFNEDHDAGKYFKAMLCYQKMKDLRESRFMQLKDQIAAVALKKDEVIPPIEVLNILKGDYRDIPIPVDIFDFTFQYNHISPFPNSSDVEDEVDYYFNKIFEIAAGHLG